MWIPWLVFLIVSIKKARASCWAEGKDGISGSQEEERDERKEVRTFARFWEGKQEQPCKALGAPRAYSLLRQQGPKEAGRS